MDNQVISPETDVAVLVISCDAYRDLWHPFFRCFFKYWPDCPFPLFLGTNHLGYPDVRVQPLRIGDDRDYSSNLLRMLDHIDQEWVILWIEDRFLSTPVDTARVLGLIRTAQRNRAGYLKLIANYPLSQVDDPSLQIGEIPKGVRYRVSITVALWQKRVLSKILRPGETAWDIERMGSVRSNRLDDKFYCLSSKFKTDPPIADVHGIVKGKWIRDAYDFLRKEGLQECIQNRPVQTIWSHLYGKAYIFRLGVYDKLGLYWRY